MQKEVWKDIPNYEGLYQVSNLGRVKSLPKTWIGGCGAKNSHNGLIMKPAKNKSGYNSLLLSYRGISKSHQIHQLVAMAFLNHVPCGLNVIVDHINNDKLDNRLENLQLITNRENCSKDRKNKTSKYIGVSWCKYTNKWISKLQINKKNVFLGRYLNEYDAHITYQNKLKEILH